MRRAIDCGQVLFVKGYGGAWSITYALRWPDSVDLDEKTLFTDIQMRREFFRKWLDDTIKEESGRVLLHAECLPENGLTSGRVRAPRGGALARERRTA